MAVNVELTKRVQELLGTRKQIEQKKMFRGIAFMVNGKMCVTVGDNRLMCRIDPQLHEQAIAQQGVKTVQMKGRDYIGWVYVDEDVIPSKKALAYWVKLALDFNEQIRE